MKTQFLIYFVLSILTISCSQDYNFKTSSNFKKVYTYVKAKDFSYGKITRRSIFIKIPSKLRSSAIEDNIKDAALRYLKAATKEINALYIYAYRESDSALQIRVATGIYAPDGKWENAAQFRSYSGSNGNKMKITIDNGYFQEPSTSKFKVGNSIIVKKGEQLTKSSDKWDVGIIKTLKKSRKAKILKIKVHPITASYNLIRYKVKLHGKVGWIHESSIKKH